MNLFWLITIIVCAGAALYTLIAFFVLGVLDARANDPPFNPSRVIFDDNAKRLSQRKDTRETKALFWLPLLLWHLVLRWIALAVRWVIVKIGQGLLGIRQLGIRFATPKAKAEPVSEGDAEAKAELPKARVVR